MEAARNGSMARTILSTGTPPMVEETKRQTPNGGVVNPIMQLRTKIMPKCKGSTPAVTTTGNRTGAIIMIIIAGSMKVPMKRIRMFSIIKRIYLLGAMDKSRLARRCGSCSTVRAQPKTPAADNKIRMAPVMMPARRNNRGKSLILSPR